MTIQDEEAPAGYLRNARGHLVPEQSVRPIDRARDDLVRSIAAGAIAQSRALREFKQSVFGDIDAFVALSAEQYGANLGGKKGNLTLHTFDGRYRVNVAKQDRLRFDERLQAAQELINECLTDWTEGARDELRTLVTEAFATDQEGKVNTGRVLALRRWDIKDKRWERAMDAISDAVQVVATATYLRVYERVGQTDQYRPISLDVQGV